ncbi:oligopeptide transport system substrate-binding protein [Spiroplasma gladiatoris]|uniref:Oligopeptide transport system substrate-binding protein n=1 Tax=Spiroplasma gladiatoris TaxID=2143 RepID=A0A4P7AJG0_9MOLU|nr:ABC transporter substrate-binding protein [Spiroplasma gladiatoris]QBQ07938.1 oligopeptide transport system substrate-binding protein [Spiroplasma gladiatoris]
MNFLLKSLMSVTLISLPVTNIVACKKNKDPENTLKLNYTNNPLHWVTARTMTINDFKVLANTNATPLSTDEYGREFGELFKLTNKNFSKEDSYIGEHNSDFTEWTYILRSDATWSDYTGKLIRNINVNDFINTAKYVLDPSNSADSYFLWQSFIEGAEEIRYAALTDTTKDFSTIFEENKSKLGLIVDENNNTIKFKLKKPASYFETLLTYSVFSPIHENTLTDPSVDKDFKKGYYSGAYTPKEFKIDTQIVLDKNPNYYFSSETKIDRIREYYVAGDVSQTRNLFESGTINEYQINSNDSAGWEKYVGDANSPKQTDGLVKYDESPEDAYTQMLFFNFLNSEYFSGDSSKKAASKIKSKLLQFKETREFFFANLDRNVWGQYYSKIFDNNNNVSSNIRNTFTADFIKTDSKDFQEFEAEQIKNKYNGLANKETTKEDIKDGKDFFKVRQYGQEVSSDKNKLKSAQKEAANKLRASLETDNDLKAVLANNGKITLNTFIDPSKTTLERASITEMFELFNAIENNPIKVSAVVSQTPNDYQNVLDEGTEDLAISGWSPDYADAMSYSNTLKLNGDHNMHFRTSQLFGFDDKNTPLKSFKEETAEDAFSRLEKGHQDLFNDLFIKDQTKQLFIERYNYSRDLENIDQTQSDPNKRNEGFAKLEAETLYRDYFAMPLIRRSPSMNFSISKLTPFSMSKKPYGLSEFQYALAGFNSSYLKYEEIQSLKEQYLKNRQEVLQDKTTHRDRLPWKN